MWEYNYTNNDELYHYGVLGMKWGVRRGNVSKAYSKASKKLSKLDSKVQKEQVKADKKMSKVMQKEGSFFSTQKGIDKARNKAKEAQRKVNKKIAKANKWYKQMEKTFANTSAKMSPEQINVGKSYADAIQRNREVNYYMR